MADVLVLDTIATLRTATIPSDVDAVFVKAYSQPQGSSALRTRGGVLFQRVPAGVTPPFGDDKVFTFLNTPVAPNAPSFWTRNLNGGVIDAYMAGALGAATLNADGTGSGFDDGPAINTLLATAFKYANNRANSLELRFSIGDGTFYVGQPLWTGLLPTSYHGWVVEGTGATILGACPKAPILDLTDRRFGTVRNLQVIGLVGADGLPISSCGIRVGRNENNAAANQMTMDHVGIDGHFHVAAMLNVGSEQFAAIGCDFTNEAQGEKYGYAGDGFNCLQWMRPTAFSGMSYNGNATYTITGSVIDGLSANDIILIRTVSGESIFTEHLLTVVSVNVGAGTFIVKDLPSTADYGAGKYYKQLYGGADPVGTPGFTPWQVNSFKQQYHQQGNYRAPRGVAGMLETCDSQHIYQMVHPTTGYYPDTPLAKTTVTAVTTGATTTITVATPPGATFAGGDLVALDGVPNPLGGYLNSRLFKVGGAGVTSGQFELCDLADQPIDSSAWGASATGLNGVAVRQKVAGGNDAFAGGFGMRMLVSSQAGCDVSSYLIHQEASSYSIEEGGVTYAGETTWWASVESFEGWRDKGTPGFAPSPVVLTDVSFAEAAAHGRGGFLLAPRDTTSGVTMLGGKIALSHAANGFGGVTRADRLLTASGTGNSLWTLAGTDLVLDEAALVDVSRLAGFSGRLAAQDAAFTAGITAVFPGTLAVIQALAGLPRSTALLAAQRYDALLAALEQAGVLAKLDALHVFAAPNEAAAKVNLARPAFGSLVVAGAVGNPPSFIAGRGFTGLGPSSKYLQSPATVPGAGLLYVTDSASMGLVNRVSPGTGVNHDIRLATDVAYVDPYSGSTPRFRTRANDTAEQFSNSNPSAIGFFAWSRSASSGYRTYWGASTAAQPAAASVTQASSSVAPTQVQLLRSTTHQLSAAFFGGGLADAEMNALYAALKTYLTAVGAWL